MFMVQLRDGVMSGARRRPAAQLGGFIPAELLTLAPLINTPLQRGVRHLSEDGNRFNGFQARETVETVSEISPPVHTPLKLGVNERGPRQHCQPMK
jgi:hypothetical protein